MSSGQSQPEPATKRAKALCLNMIVKNERANLERCLSAVADYIDCWVIVDTGSTDGTQDFIKAFFAERNKPGELHSVPFHNFEQARNAALECAAGSSLAFDYLLLCDADMELVVEDKHFRERLDAPGYTMVQKTGSGSGLTYWNGRIVARNIGACYHGVTHEYLEVPGSAKALEGAWFKDHATGSNRGDKFERDVKLLLAGLEQEPDNHRYWFYLAQSYADAGRTQEAIETYTKRADMGGWEEEAWYARLQLSRCLRTLGDDAAFVSMALSVFNQRPWRAEPLYDLARHFRERGMNDASLVFAEAGFAIEMPKSDVLFVEDFAYNAGPEEEYAIAANYSRDPSRKERGRLACNWLALDRNVPPQSRELARRNLDFYVQPVRELLPSFRATKIAFDMPPDYRPTNPSIARVGDGLVMNLRAVNFFLNEDGKYRTRDGSPAYTRNFLIELASNLEIRSAIEILRPPNFPKPAYDLVHGFEDLRLFGWRGSIWASACVRELTKEGWCEQVLVRIDRKEGSARLEDWQVTRPDGPRRDEKNWMPLIERDQLRFIYSCDPVRVVDAEGHTVVETSSPICSDEFRGGSQAIAFDGGWLTLVHEVRLRDGKRWYRHRFVWFDRDFHLKRVSKQFFFERFGIEFAAGLAWHPDGARLVVSYGVGDAEAWLGAVDATEVRKCLLDAEQLPSAKSDTRSRVSSPMNSPGDNTQGAYRLETMPKEANLGSTGRKNLVDHHAVVSARQLRGRIAGTPRVLLAILAKQKEEMLPLYLECIEALDYPKERIVLYIRTNNNTDGTERILREWVERVRSRYADVEFDASDVADQVQKFAPHEWNAARFKVLGDIRNVSLRRTLDLGCDFYFVADVDNFIRPNTLRELVALNLPIVAPLLRSIEPGVFYSNYHAEVSADGYLIETDQYMWILNQWIRGVMEVPVVHTTYLVRADVIDELNYRDATDRYEYVIFSDTARKASIPQYLDNRQVYGYIVFGRDAKRYVEGGIDVARALLTTVLASEGAHPENRTSIIRVDAPPFRRDRQQRICLCMIVKNEARVIERCLASVRPIIDYWVIVDTGSTDGTQDIILNYFKDVPGELHQRPWVDFAHNRSEGLQFAQGRADYSLIIDADDWLEIAPGFELPDLNADTYGLDVWHIDRRYRRPHLVNNARAWRYEGVLHEFLSCPSEGGGRILPEQLTSPHLPGLKILIGDDGARRQRSQVERYGQDAETLERALATETDPLLVSRYSFYLAQSYENAGKLEPALRYYLKRAELGFWEQEVYLSLYRAAALKDQLGYDAEDVIATYLKAHAVDKTRAEALHGAAAYCRHRERFAQGYAFAKDGLKLSRPDGVLFHEEWIYSWGLADECAVCAYWLGKFDECLQLCKRLLQDGNIPASLRPRIENNANFAQEKLAATPARSKIFSCFGLHSSGSTWMFNLVRAICEAKSIAFVSVHRDAMVNLPWDLPGSPLIIAKTHYPMADYQTYLAKSADPVLITTRDPRDAVVSYMQRFPKTAADFEQTLDKIAQSAERIVAITHVKTVPVFRYEDGFSVNETTADAVANLLGVTLGEEERGEILASLTPEAVREKIGQLEAVGYIAGEAAWDSETNWHANHVGDGRVGKWQEILTPSQAQRIVEKTREYCQAFGYAER